MKKITVFVLLVVVLMMAIALPVFAEKPTSFDNNGNGKDFVTEAGFDETGYNYRAHMFSAPWGDDYLIMKWNDAWLSNLDQDGDGVLDRHYGYDSYIGSGAWLTNHQSGEYELDGQICKWNYFVKIIAAPADATANDGIWYNADGTEIGPVIWGAFAIIQEVENDACAGVHGLQFNSPDHPGLGNW